jgi:Zn-dependent protease with chaperone function
MSSRDETGAHWAKTTLPVLYVPAVCFWCVVFGSISVFLVLMYVLFAWSGVTGLAVALERAEDKSSEYITSFIFLIAGVALLAAFVRAVTARQSLSGVAIDPIEFETLRTLIAECAVDAGINPPEILYLTPDMTVAAYTAGRLSLTREGKRDAVIIGAGALLLLPRSDLRAILLHEFAHIALRRKVLSADICNKMYNFVPRFASAHRHALAAIVTIIPFLVFSILWRSSQSSGAYSEKLCTR